MNEVFVLAWMGDVQGAQAAVDLLVEEGSLFGEFIDRVVYAAIGLIRLAEGDAPAAREAYEVALQRTPQTRGTALSYGPAPLAPLACGDVTTARLWADGVVSVAKGVSLVGALTCRARVALAEGEIERAAEDAREALGLALDMHGYVVTVPDGIECLAYVAAEGANDRESARLFGAAASARRQASVPRLKTLDADHECRLAVVRDRLGESDFQVAWDEGEALTIEEAISYARRGRGERKRPTTGWESLTPTELDVVRLACEGLGNKEIAARLFVSPRTVQAHLSHVYAKLGVSSRVQLAQEASRH